MQPPLPTVVTDELRRAVRNQQDRLDAGTVAAAAGWEVFAQALGFDSLVALDVSGPQPAIVVGAIADVLDVACRRTSEFGFVTPAARRAKPWRRSESWTLDPTLRLWEHGWSPVVVERIVASTREGEIEFVVGDVRPTPTSASAFDDSD